MVEVGGSILRDVEASAGRSVAMVEYELQAERAIGTAPSDGPAWYWCTLRPGGRQFLSAVESMVGGDPRWDRVADQGNARCFTLTGAGRTATLLEDEWVGGGDGRWHFEWRLRAS